MDALVRARGLGYRYGSRTALHDADLDVGRGQIVGLAGPNGSGKTTLLKLLAGFLEPAEGELTVFGLRPFRDAPRMLRRVRFAFAPPALFERLTAREHLRHLAAIGGPVPGADEIEATLHAVGLERRADESVAGFSFGMRQRLVLAQALLPRPELLVLDEPNDGLDPLAVLELRALLVRLRDEHGMSVLLSSHLLLELEELVDHLLVLSEGETVFSGSPQQLTGVRARLRLTVRDVERALRLLRARGFEVFAGEGGELELEPESLTLGEAWELLREAGLDAYRVHRPALEEVLLDILRRRASPASSPGERA